MSVTGDTAADRLVRLLDELEGRKLLGRVTSVTVAEVSVVLSSVPPPVDATGGAHDSDEPNIDEIVERRVEAKLANMFGHSA